MFLNRLFAAPRVLLAVSCLLAASVALGQGVDNPAVFELDGNTQVSSSKDWESTFAAGTPKTLIPIQDPAPNSIYTGGGSKDTNDVSQWKHKDGSVPDKDDIRQAAAVALPLPNGNLAIYFTATRFANNGDAQVGFWFFQKKVTPQPDGTFGPAPGQIANHENGDLLVLVNFEGGGLTPSIQVYQWQGGVNGGPVLVSAGLKVGQCGTGPNAGNHDVCAITNAGDSNAPASWGYEPKAGTAGVFPAQTFFEGAVNLSVIFGAGNVPCFSSFIAETRSSSSITAQLKDFAEGNFDVCKISVTKTCSTGTIINNGTQMQYTFSGKVKNEGAGTVYDVIVEDTPGTTGTQTPANPISVAASLAPNAEANWSATFVTTSLAFNNSVEAKAASSPGANRTVTATASASCGGTVSAGVSVTKSCSPGTSLVDAGTTIVVQVGVSGQVCNEGTVRLTGVALSHVPNATVTLASTTLNPKGQTGECAAWSVTYQPDTITSGNGSGVGRYYFDDQIRVTAATPVLGPPLTPIGGTCGTGNYACAGASCAICPPGSAACP